MTGEQIFELIILIGCAGGCGCLFLGMGLWAKRSSKPVHFYSGTTVDPKRVSDIPAYNHACARMWMWFSVPFFLAVAFAVLGIWYLWANWIMISSIVLDCTVGIGWLLARYRKIEKTYIT